MSVATGTEAALRTQLGQIIRLEHLLQGRLHPELRTYLSAASPDFRNFTAARDLVDQWQIQFRALPDLLTAFARDVRYAVQESGSTTGARDLHPFAILRDSSLRIEQHLNALDAFSAEIASFLPPEAATEAQMPTLPQFRRVTWVNHLAALPPDALQQDAQRVEAEARQFVAHGDTRIPARLDAVRETCSRHEEIFLQQYWNTLRAHAQAHYVEDRDIADVLADLTQRYVTSDLDRRQRDLSTADPFATER
jgi:hypothetical protein